MSCDLGGLSVLVTRPQQQAQNLCDLIEQAHGRALRFAVMEIAAVEDAEAARHLLSDLRTGDWLIFVSVNAVQYAYPLLPEELPMDLQIAAIGNATAKALEAIGLPPSLCPQAGFNSESLLQEPALQQMQGRRVVILRGLGGREKLRHVLQQRGAEVRYAEVYQRRLPQRSAANLVRNWEQMVDVVTLTSVQMLENLCILLGEAGRAKLVQTPVVVFGERVARAAREQGCEQVYVSAEASDLSLLKALCELSRRP